ncbi:TPA: hypothetical protein HA241_04680 [Candidatus Woesearchaeota archaeon]|nr:hypothetical protein [Candidatus Woesearchaeota archaeon]
MHYIRKFQTISKNDTALAGGKGASLGEMTNAGIPVPPGFVILADTFEQFLQRNNIHNEIDAVLHTVDHQKMHTIEHASEQIKAIMLSQPLPNEITQEIQTAFAALKTPFVAVRSSATVEDGSTAAWAGQLESYLNTTKDNLLENVKKCWASLFTPRAIFYRFEQNLHEQHISVAVVMQKMVESEVSGIAFSVHPVTQDRNQLIIEAGLGLGEAIVSGQITPDSYVVEKKERKIIEKAVNTQSKGLFRSLRGENEWKNISKSNKQKLTDTQIIELSELIIKIEQHYSFPVDVEWALEKGKFYIVQSRPITTLTDKITETKQDWPLNGEIFQWGPIPGRFIWPGGEFIDVCCGVVANKFGGLRWPPTLFLFKGKRMLWLNEWPALRSFGKDIFLRYMLPKSSWKEIYAQWTTAVEKLLSFEKTISQAQLQSLSNQNLRAKWNEFHDLLKEFWVLTIPAELGNYGSPDLLQEELRKYISNDKELKEAMEILTAPEEISFYQQEEIDLLKTTNVAKHQQKYFWLKNSYAGVQALDIAFFSERQKKISPALERELENNLKTTKQRKKNLAHKFSLPDSLLHLARVISCNIEWQDQRKKYIFVNLHYKDNFLKEVVRRFHYEYEDVLNCWYKEVARIISGKNLKKTLLQRRKGFGIHFDSSVNVLSTTDTLRYWNHYAEQDVELVNQFQGIIACSGVNKTISGKVRILLDPYDTESFQEGDILVAPMTSPEYVFAMKKATAIITDTGGLTSHAAIVSRELKKLCIVGTKIATKVLKDGDIVEVNANQGIVKVLARKS